MSKEPQLNPKGGEQHKETERKEFVATIEVEKMLKEAANAGLNFGTSKLTKKVESELSDPQLVLDTLSAICKLKDVAEFNSEMHLEVLALSYGFKEGFEPLSIEEISDYLAVTKGHIRFLKLNTLTRLSHMVFPDGSK